jgi:NADH:ubiquinone oxidoreductase subunit C
MGKTVESYRMALESEINRWNAFARALRKDDREAFEELMDSCRNNAMAAGNATNLIIFEPMVMSILLGQQKRLRKLEQELKVFEKTYQASSIDQANKKP